MKNNRPRLVLLYHFFHPDDVISARLYSDLAEEFAKQGCEVVAMPSVRSCHDGEAAYARRENWDGVEIHRVWRPDWRQGSNKGRVGNTIAMLAGWTWRALWTRRAKNETVIIGTDPPLGVLVAIPWRLFRPRARIVHWCHDLYPHAAVAEGIVSSTSVLVRVLNAILRVAYARCDVIADLGPCMRDELLEKKKLAARGETTPSPPTPLPGVPGRGEPVTSALQGGEVSGAALQPKPLRSKPLTKHVTLTPWALVEPASVLEVDEGVRRDLFGNAKLGLLYSGNLGRAHVYQPFVELARRVSGDSIAFCYAGRGPRMDLLRAEVGSREIESDLGGNEADQLELNSRGIAPSAPAALAPLAPVLRGEGLGVRGQELGESDIEPTEPTPSPPTPLPGVPGRGEPGLHGGNHPGVPGQGELSLHGSLLGILSSEESHLHGGNHPGDPGQADPSLRESYLGITGPGDSSLHSGSYLGIPGRGDSGLHKGHRSKVLVREGEIQARPLKIRFAGFASEEELGKRLGAADVHMVSLAPNWTGAVVPSKFFGALAVGRPVLFAGSRKSAIAQWIEEFEVGWVLDDDASVERVAMELREFANDPSRVKAMREHCFQIYRREFSKAVQMEKWKELEVRS